MEIDYSPLWKTLENKQISKKEFRSRTSLASSTYSKLINNENVTIETIGRICDEFDCKVEEVVKFYKP